MRVTKDMLLWESALCDVTEGTGCSPCCRHLQTRKQQKGHPITIASMPASPRHHCVQIDTITTQAGLLLVGHPDTHMHTHADTHAEIKAL